MVFCNQQSLGFMIHNNGSDSNWITEESMIHIEQLIRGTYRHRNSARVQLPSLNLRVGGCPCHRALAQEANQQRLELYGGNVPLATLGDVALVTRSIDIHST